jgi:hypothetical protein
MRPRIGALVLALCLTLGVASQARANPLIDLGVNFYPNGLNNHQVVVGEFDLQGDSQTAIPSHAYVWKAGVMTKLHEPNGAYASDAYAVSDAGRIVGDAKGESPYYPNHGEYWDGPDDAPHQVGPVEGEDKNDYSEVTDVTTSGEMVGQTVDSTATAFAFLGFHASASGAITRVGTTADGTTSVAGITPDGTKMFGHASGTYDNGNYAGEGWYLWPGSGGTGTKLDLTPFVQGNQIFGTVLQGQYSGDLASDGSVLGYKGDSVKTYYVRMPNGSEKLVDGLIGHNGLNAKHVVAGTILGDYMGSQVPHAAIWKPTATGGTVVDLNSLIPADSGYVLYDALGINDNGDVVGEAARIADGVSVGFLLPAGYVVDSAGDEEDTAAGDGACLTSAGTCTLRAALQEVSAGTSSAPTSVSFNLPTDTTTIAPASALPPVLKPISIDGSTNPGGRVVLDGANAKTGAVGLRLQGDGSILRGMDIEHFDDAGVRINGSNMVIGGLATDTPPCAFPCNIVKDNKSSGIVVTGNGSINDLLQGNRLTGNARPAIDLGGDGRTPNDRVDADTGANGLHNFPIGVLSEKDPVTKVVKISGVDPIADESERIDVYAQSSVTAARGAEPADYVGTTIVQETGGWELDLPAALPAADTFFSATLTDRKDGTSELSPICGDPDGDGNPDSDGDGLCDDWELHGIDADDDGTVDLPLNDAIYNASPTHKDLYLELDAMNDGVAVEAPQQAAVDDVVKAFADAPIDNASGGTGISLHVNPGRPTVDDRVPEEDMNTVGTGEGTLDFIRNGTDGNPCDGAFGSADDRAAPDCYKRLAARDLAFRWVLFANTFSEQRGSSGFSAGLGGKELTVTLGQWPAASIIYGGGGIAWCETLAHCREINDAGTLMHEFGHSLGLHHGGRDDVQYKPNYLSVMNYLYQTPDRVHGRPLDYSLFALPTLDENALVESAGILGGVDAATRAKVKDLFPQIAFFTGTPGHCNLRTTSSDGPIDWSDSTPITIASTVVHDANCGEPKTTLKSSEDWPDLRYSFRDQTGALQAPAEGDSAQSVPEETDAQVLAYAATSDADGNGVNDLADACREVAGSGFADANGNGFADVCEADLNRLQAFPSQPGGAGGGGGGGAPSGPAKDTTAPALSKLIAKPSAAQLATKHRKAKPATLRFTDSEASTVTFTGEQALKGRKKGKKCVTGGKKGKACTNYKKLGGSLRINAKAGANTVTFAAKLGTKKLKAGTYRLTAIAIDAAGNRSKPITVVVTVR